MSSKNSGSGAKRWLAEFLLRSPVPLGSLRRVPLLGRLAHRASRSILPAHEKVWAQVEAGPSRGLWLELNPRTGQGYFRGEVELSSQQALAQWLRPGMVFYDLGANLGLFTLLAARLVGPSGRVLSFEPDPEVAARLKSNIARNGFENVVVVEAGVWSSSGTIGFSPADQNSPDRGTGHVGHVGNVAGGSGGFAVRSVALDDFVKDAPPPDAIKCDVEGAELEVLKGAEALLRARHPWILCEMHSEANARSGRDFLANIGYRAQSLDANHVFALPENENEAAARPKMSTPESPEAEPAAEQWIALLGRRDEPTDGVEDYCMFLGRALAPRGVTLQLVRVEWDKEGWSGALGRLRRDSANWHNKRVILQYTALAWSRRGFPRGALRVLDILRRRGVCCAVMFHEPLRQASGARLIDRLRGAYQEHVIRRLYAGADKAIFPDPLGRIAWLPRHSAKAFFVPIGANVPDSLASPESPDARASSADTRTVSVFCISEPPHRRQEVGDIAHAVSSAAARGLKLRLVLIGKGTPEAKEAFDQVFQGAPVEVLLLGLRSAEEVRRTLAASDVMLCIRGKLYPRRGSALAGIACGLPLVGFAGASEGTPLEEAGVVLVPYGDREALADALVSVLSDPERRQQLRARSLRAHEKYFSWKRIAAEMLNAMGTPPR